MFEFELSCPKLRSRLGTGRPAARWVAMPEASVYEDYLPQARQDEIRRTRQIAAVEPEAVPFGMYQPSHDHLRFGVSPPHPPHEDRTHRIDRLSGQGALDGVLWGRDRL
jgi:hypothetical protein